MASRPAIGIVTQVGAEVTPGTAVACGIKFPGLQVMLKPDIGVKMYRPNGRKTSVVGVLNNMSSTGDYSGPLTYGELLYPLAGYVHRVSSVQIGATAGYTHTFKPRQATVDTVSTFTLQYGDSNAAQQVDYGIFNSLSIGITRQEGTMSGGLLARKINNAASLTGSPATLENIPVSLNDINVYLDTTYGGIGVTKLTDVFNISIDCPPKFVPKWVLNSANTSWKEATEMATQPKIKVECEYSSQMRALYTALLVDSLPTYYIRVAAVGENIGVSADYTFQWSAAVKLVDAQPIADKDSVFGYTFDFEMVDDSTMGAPYEIALVNTIANPT